MKLALLCLDIPTITVHCVFHGTQDDTQDKCGCRDYFYRSNLMALIMLVQTLLPWQKALCKALLLLGS